MCLDVSCGSGDLQSDIHQFKLLSSVLHPLVTDRGTLVCCLMSHSWNGWWWDSQDNSASSSEWWQQADAGSQVAAWESDPKQGSTSESVWKADKIVRDRFRHCTTLGDRGKHPIPLDDRKALVLGLVAKMSLAASLSRVAVASWTAITTHAALWLLCRASPRTSVRTLRDDKDMYTNEHAIDVLYESALGLHPSQQAREIICTIVRENCWEGETAYKILEAAMIDNFDPTDVSEDSLCSSPNPKIESRSIGGGNQFNGKCSTSPSSGRAPPFATH